MGELPVFLEAALWPCVSDTGIAISPGLSAIFCSMSKPDPAWSLLAFPTAKKCLLSTAAAVGDSAVMATAPPSTSDAVVASSYEWLDLVLRWEIGKAAVTIEFDVNLSSCGTESSRGSTATRPPLEDSPPSSALAVIAGPSLLLDVNLAGITSLSCIWPTMRTRARAI